jgi:hypothetical protein
VESKGTGLKTGHYEKKDGGVKTALHEGCFDRVHSPPGQLSLSHNPLSFPAPSPHNFKKPPQLDGAQYFLLRV